MHLSFSKKDYLQKNNPYHSLNSPKEVNIRSPHPFLRTPFPFISFNNLLIIKQNPT